MEFNRTGNMSVYGDMVVNYVSPEGKITKVGEIKGLAIYAPGTLRRCRLKLQEPDGVDYSIGKLTIIYSTPHAAKSINLARADFVFSQ